MLYITCYVSGAGRSGHKLLQIFTCFVLKALFNAFNCPTDVLYHKSWATKEQQFMSVNVFKQNCVLTIPSRHHTISYKPPTPWFTFTRSSFLELLGLCQTKCKQHANVCLQLFGTGRSASNVLAHAVQSWPLKPELYKRTLVPQFRTMYEASTGNRLLPARNVISIHVRRGDLAKRMKHLGFTCDYYKRLIGRLHRRYPTMRVEIYCEDVAYQDLNALRSLPHTALILGNVKNFEQQVYMMAKSRVLVLSASSMALFMGYLCYGRVLIDEVAVAMRSEVFVGADI